MPQVPCWQDPAGLGTINIIVKKLIPKWTNGLHEVQLDLVSAILDKFGGDSRKHVTNSGVSGISAIGFNFLKYLTIRTLLSIYVEVIMNYEWNLRW